MNLIAAAPAWLLIILVVALLAAVIEDAGRLRISNLTSLIVVAGAVCAAAVAGLEWSLWQNLLVFAVILAFGTAAFAAGVLGGGDVKLFAAVGLWVDWHTAAWLVALVLIAGGVVATGYLLARTLRRDRRRDRRIPYGVAIALGAFGVIASTHGWIPHRERPLPPAGINLDGNRQPR